MNKFKVGDLVTGGSGNTYGVTVGDFVGVVVRSNKDVINVDIVKSATTRGNEYTIPPEGSLTFDVDPSKFIPYTGPDPRELKPMKPVTKVSSSHPQVYMTGIDVKIDNSEGWDPMTEDYIGEVGNILSYDKWEVDYGCWILCVIMKDGEILEVLECELANYDLLSGKTTQKKTSITVTPKGPKYAAKVEDTQPIYGPYKVGIDPYLAALAPKPAKPALKFEVNPFDLTPKKKSKPKLVF